MDYFSNLQISGGDLRFLSKNHSYDLSIYYHSSVYELPYKHKNAGENDDLELKVTWRSFW